MMQQAIHEADFHQPIEWRDCQAGWKAWILETFCKECKYHNVTICMGTREDVHKFAKTNLECPDCSDN